MAEFTTQELDLASDPTILLIKYRMMEKVWGFLEELQQEIRTEFPSYKNALPKEINLEHGKISKGENYKRLPYLILDYPAHFTKNDIFAFRTMFYWGNFLSATFHIQGAYLRKYGADFIATFKGLENVYFCVGSSPWEYHYKSNNYTLLNEMTDVEIDDHVEHCNFIKLSVKFPVEEMPNIKVDLKDFLFSGLKVIQTN